MSKNMSNKDLTCAWEQGDCERPSRKKGYCNSHYTWHHKNTPRPNQRLCSIVDCGAPHRGRGYCANHYSKFYQKDRSALISTEDTFDYNRYWLWVKRELKL